MGINKTTFRAAWLAVVFCGCFLLPPLFAMPDEAAGPRVHVRAWVEPEGPVAVTRQLLYIIEISTPTWFSGGLRIKPPELKDAVVRQAGQLATNFTRDVDGQTWSVQQWTFFIYPLEERHYRIPEQPVKGFVAYPDGSRQPWARQTPAVPFSANIPPSLKNTAGWVAAPRFTVREEYRGVKEVYSAGDAIERRIVAEADDLPGMMLPVVTDMLPEGLAVYPDPPDVTDDVNRGRIAGRRVEHLTYVVEKPGSYLIPQRTYSWYNTSTGTAEEIILEEKRITTPGFENRRKPMEKPRPGPQVKMMRPITIFAILIFFVPAVLFLRWWKKNQGARKYASQISSRGWRRELKRAAASGNTDRVVEILYRWFDHYGNADRNFTHWRELIASAHGLEKLAHFNSCMRHIYGREHEDVPAMPPVRELGRLLSRRAVKSGLQNKRIQEGGERDGRLF